MNIEIKLGRNHCSARSDDSSMMTFILIVFFIFIPLISENVIINCQASNILVEIQKSLFTDTDNDTEFAATDLVLNDRDCNATNGSNTFDFDIIHAKRCMWCAFLRLIAQHNITKSTQLELISTLNWKQIFETN